MALYLGIDIGTSASKGVLIDDRCNIVCQASCGHETDNPCDGWYQHDAEAVWWGDFCRLSRELVMRSGVNAAQIGCVGLSALGCDCVPVDTECNALRPRFCMESMHVRSRRLTSSFPNMGQVAHANFSGTIPAHQILLLRSYGLRRICPRCTNVPRSS
mgnify:CR=1 FL=1